VLHDILSFQQPELWFVFVVLLCFVLLVLFITVSAKYGDTIRILSFAVIERLVDTITQVQSCGITVKMVMIITHLSETPKVAGSDRFKVTSNPRAGFEFYNRNITGPY